MLFLFKIRAPSKWWGSQIKDKVIFETFLRWVRTSANFEEVPWLSFEPEVSKLPSVRNNSVSSTFLTAESFSVCLNEPNELSVYHFFSITEVAVYNTVCLHSSLQFYSLENFLKKCKKLCKKTVDKKISLVYNNLCKQKEVGKSQEFTGSIVERRWWDAISKI